MRRSGRYQVQIGNGLIRERHFTPFFANDTGIKRYLLVKKEAEEKTEEEAPVGEEVASEEEFSEEAPVEEGSVEEIEGGGVG